MTREELYIQNLGALIRQETVSSYENPRPEGFPAFREVLKQCFPHFFAAARVELFHGSLLMCLPGQSSEAPILFMNHHDVVEAQEGWTHPPFCGEVFDGRLWGRGTLDTKGGLWAMLQAAEELCTEGFVPERDIYFESSCNEENTMAGSMEIGQVLLKRGIRFALIMDEGGMVMTEPIAGAKGTYAVIGVAEKDCLDLKFTARSRGGHASTPEQDSPLVRLGKFMAEADKNKCFSVQLASPIREMLRRLSRTVSGPVRIIYRHPDLFAPLLKPVMSRVSPGSRAMVQTTLAFTMASGSEGRNVIPAEAWVVGNMRASKHQGAKNSVRAVTELAARYDISVELLDPGVPSGVADFTARPFRFVEEAVAHAFPGVIPTPYIMNGCSDARNMAALSDSILHFNPFYVDEAQVDSIHGLDENVYVSTLVPAVEFYKYMMREMKSCE